MDVAGVVEAVGAGVTEFRPGDEVMAMLGSRFGGHAEFAVADSSSAIVLKPASASFDEATALVFGGITARGFVNQPSLGPRSHVLVNGASGAVGSAAVQLAKAVGARVTAVCSARNASLVAGLGADRVIDYETTDFAAEDATYDIITDCVGNAPVTRARPVVAPGGAVLLVVGDLRSVLMAAQSQRFGLTVATAPGPYLAADLEYLVGLFDSGQLRSVVDRTYPLNQIVNAHRYVDTNHKRGNVVIDVA
jgi:NADPH:quinone reductase-like Zn-dependent oxidoreductase